MNNAGRRQQQRQAASEKEEVKTGDGELNLGVGV